MKKLLSLVMVFAILATFFVMPASADGQRVVNVNSVEQLTAALESDTKIILAPGKYIFESETEYMVFDDGTVWDYEVPKLLDIREISNVTIEGNGQAEIVLDVGYEAVVRITNAHHITLSGLILGHDVPEYGCEGEGHVISLVASDYITVQNCDLYGCGVSGINSWGTGNVTVNNTIIRDCMVNAASFYEATGEITFNDCTFSANAYDELYAEMTPCFEFNKQEGIASTPTASFNNCKFINNKNMTFVGSFYSGDDKLDWIFTNGCTFTNNAWESSVSIMHNNNGEWSSVYFDDQRPAIVNDRTLVPLRGVLEDLGYNVEWDAPTRTATINRNDLAYNVKVSIDSNIIYKGDEAIEIDVPACIMNDRTMVPLRAISEAFDMGVEWNAYTRTVLIYAN